MKYLPSQLLALSLFFLTAGTAWSDQPSGLSKSQGVAPVNQEILIQLRESVNTTITKCKIAISNVQKTEKTESKQPHFWETPTKLKCLFHLKACKELRTEVQLERILASKTQFDETMKQLELWILKFDKVKEDIDRYKGVPPILQFQKQIQGDAGNIGSNCTMMTKTIQEGLRKRGHLIGKIYGNSDKIETPQ